MMKKIFLLVTLLTALLGLSGLFDQSGTAYAATAVKQQPSLVDAANVLQPVDKQKILSLIRQIEQKHKIRVAVLTVSGTQGMDIKDYANGILDGYCQDGEKGNMVMILDVGSRRWQIATDPKMRKMITDERGIPKLKESFIDALKKGDYAKAFTNYATTTDFLVNYYAKEGEAYDPSKEFSGGALAGGGAIALGIAALIRKVLMGQMSNVQPASDASAYLNKESFGLTGSNDTYLYTTTAVIPKKKENSGGSSSGGSSGGNGGGGGSF